MHRRVRFRYWPQFRNNFLKSVLFRKHVEQISSITDHLLDPYRVEEVCKSDPIHMAVGFHLKHKIIDVAEAEATMPTRVSQQIICLAEMRITGLTRLVPVH